MRRSKYNVSVRARQRNVPVDEARYVLTVSNSASHELWSVDRSFSQFCEYNVIMLMRLKYMHPCNGCCRVVHDELEKIAHRTPSSLVPQEVIEHREAKMQDFVTMLLQSFAKVPGLRNCATYSAIKVVLRTFLYVPDLTSLNPDSCQRRYFKLRKVKITENMREENCPICLSDWGDTCVVESQCGHKFHSECVTPWFKKSLSCPVCRQCVTKYTHVSHSNLHLTDANEEIMSIW